MARRALTTAQAASVEAVREAIAAERTASAEAQAEANRLVEQRTREARERTNAMVYSARQVHHVSVAVLTEEGFGNTNRKNVTDRIAEHGARFGGSTEAEQVAAATVVASGLKVISAGGDVHVMLDKFTHDDVGTLSGEYIYTSGGDLLSTSPGDATQSVELNPLLPYILWGLPEVQALT